MNFEIVENSNDDEIYEKFKKDFLDTSYSCLDLQEKYDLGGAKYKSLRRRVCAELGLKNKPRKQRLRKYIVKSFGKWVIRKNINGKRVYFGMYDELECAMKVRDELVKCNWDKDLYFEIKNMVLLEFELGLM